MIFEYRQNAANVALLEMAAESIGFDITKLHSFERLFEHGNIFINCGIRLISTRILLNERSLTYDGFLKLLEQERSKAEQVLAILSSETPPQGNRTRYRQMLTEMRRVCDCASLAVDSYRKGNVELGDSFMHGASPRLQLSAEKFSEIVEKLVDKLKPHLLMIDSLFETRD